MSYLPGFYHVYFASFWTLLPSFSLIPSHSYAGSSQARVLPSTSYAPTRQKRSYEEDDDMDDMDTQPQKQREPHAGIRSSLCEVEHICSWM